MYVCVFICSYLVWFCWVQFSTKNWTLGFLPWCLRNGRASGMVAIQVHVSRSHLAYAKGPSRKLRWVVIRGSRDHLHSNHSKSVCVCVLLVASGCWHAWTILIRTWGSFHHLYCFGSLSFLPDGNPFPVAQIFASFRARFAIATNAPGVSAAKWDWLRKTGSMMLNETSYNLFDMCAHMCPLSV